jgi:glycerol-3-phosphate O-acyltransferase
MEFFIEGGRSRTGKVLPPRFGILANVVDTVLTGGAREVTIIPVSLSYDRIIEGGSYSKEISGGEKQREDVGQVVRSAKVLDRRYGTIYISGGRPVRIGDYLRQISGNEAPEESDPERRRYLIKRLGYHVLNRINQAGVVTPSSLAATVLLSHLRRGISATRFKMTAGFLIRFARDRGANLSLALDRALKAHAMELTRAREEALRDDNEAVLDLARGAAVWDIVEGALENMLADKHIEARVYEDETIYSVVPDSRVFMDYYRNNILHFFQREAFVAMSVLSREYQGRLKQAEVVEDCKFLSDLLKREFVYRVGDLARGIDAGLRVLAEHGGLVQEEDGAVRIKPDGEPRLVMFSNLILPIVEAYFICARHLSLLRWKGAMNRKELARGILQRARREYHEGLITCQEAMSMVSLSNAVDAFLGMGILKKIESGMDQGKLRFTTGTSELELEKLRERLAFLVRKNGVSILR